MISQVKIAEEFARFHHRDQMYGNLPYIVHLIHCQQIAKKYPVENKFFDKEENAILRTALWLHDIVEYYKYTNLELEDLVTLFNNDVISIVDDLTDKDIRGETRETYKKRSYNVIKENYRSAYVKLVDRCANLEFSLNQKKHKKLTMYVGEHEDFSIILNMNNTVYFNNLHNFYLMLIEQSQQLLTKPSKKS
jgi:hypothetical protein